MQSLISMASVDSRSYTRPKTIITEWYQDLPVNVGRHVGCNCMRCHWHHVLPEATRALAQTLLLGQAHSNTQESREEVEGERGWQAGM